ncbi:MAG: glycosyltransferase family 9 protein [Alphaproteobacteria bacterium]|nr:glycosyltransferase family 9 protein [Alphaproteobacteria bacterium]
MDKKQEHILVIRAGALGDLVFCFQSFAAIRAAHPHARIALLTRAPFVAFAQTMPWFDTVITDTKPTMAQPAGWLRLMREIKRFAPTRIYDLQGKTRQNIIYALLGGPLGPDWSGAAPLCKFPRPWPPKPGMHFTDFLAAQLRAAGVPDAAPADLGWLDAPVGQFALPPRYAVLIPGCSPGAEFKRWPAEKYAELANFLHARDLPCVIVGGKADEDAAAQIKKSAPALDLCGKTSLHELAGILRGTACVIGNDTGPTHMAGTLGAPTLALFSGRGRTEWSHPPGPRVATRQSDILADLSVGEVAAAADALLDAGK